MDRLKTFLKYALWVIGFFILSELLINVSLNSNYKTIGRKDSINQVNIYQAEATLVNGRIRGTITNSEANDISGKYIKINFYSARDVLLGKKYIQINSLKKDETQAIELFFKLQDVNYYEVSIVNQKEPGDEIEFIPKDFTKPEIILATVVTLLIFW